MHVSRRSLQSLYSLALVPTLVMVCQTLSAVEAADPIEVKQDVPPVVKPVAADEVVITATRLSENIVDQPYAIYRMDAEEADFRNTRTLVDALHAAPGIAVQRTAPNQASPFIRGLTGEQTLLMFNGIRFNSAMMRPGPNQYAALMPDKSIENVDIILGSASTVLGSDGLTGALDFRLREAGSGRTEGIGGYGDVRYGTADNGGNIAAGLDGRHGGWAWTAEINFQDFDDLRAGKDSGDNLFGSAAGNRDVANTAYDQQSVNARAIYDGIENQKFELSVGTVQQNDAPRPGGYFENSNKSDRISRYFPKQDFTYVHARHYWNPESDVISEVKTTLWYNQFDEEQIRERLRNSETQYRRRQRQDSISTIGLEVQVQHSVGENHDMTSGVTIYKDTTENEFQEYLSPDTNPANAVDNTNPANATLPDGSTYNGLGIYTQDNWHINEQWSLLSGLRYSRYAWDADLADSSVDAFTGSVRALWDRDENWNVFIGVSQGFRAPNLTNLTGADDFASGSTVFTGNPNLDPETSVSYEVGVRYDFTGEHQSYIALNVFQTNIDKVIQRASIDIDGDSTPEDVMINGRGAIINGFEFHWNAALPYFENSGILSTYSVTNFVKAEEDVRQSDGTYITDNISRANRLFGVIGLKFVHQSRWWAAGQLRWSDEYSDVAARDSGDVRLTIPGRADGSLPGYAAFDIKAGWTNEDRTQTYNLALENIADKTYRDIGSGADATGLNLVVNAKLTF